MKRRRKKTSFGVVPPGGEGASLLRRAANVKHPACKRAMIVAGTAIDAGDRPGASMALVKKGEKLLDKAIRTCIKHGEDV